MSVGRRPCPCSRWTSPAFARAVGLRPLYRPSAFALAMPSRAALTKAEASKTIKVEHPADQAAHGGARGGAPSAAAAGSTSMVTGTVSGTGPPDRRLPGPAAPVFDEAA